ncbi:hypothetical protein X777_13344, partial [Ooceraea biroi]
REIAWNVARRAAVRPAGKRNLRGGLASLRTEMTRESGKRASKVDLTPVKEAIPLRRNGRPGKDNVTRDP